MGSRQPKARVLLDQNAPKRLIRELPDFDVVTARRRGWSELSNGDLIVAAEHEGFDILLTVDRNLRYQQNLAGRSIAIVVLDTNRWTIVAQNLRLVDQALRQVERGSFVELAFRQ